MNGFILAALDVTAGWQGILLKIAILCVVAWGITQLLAWAGWPIPAPVRIIGICLLCILLIYWLFQLFNAVV